MDTITYWEGSTPTDMYFFTATDLFDAEKKFMQWLEDEHLGDTEEISLRRISEKAYYDSISESVKD